MRLLTLSLNCLLEVEVSLPLEGDDDEPALDAAEGTDVEDEADGVGINGGWALEQNESGEVDRSDKRSWCSGAVCQDVEVHVVERNEVSGCPICSLFSTAGCQDVGELIPVVLPLSSKLSPMRSVFSTSGYVSRSNKRRSPSSFPGVLLASVDSW